MRDGKPVFMRDGWGGWIRVLKPFQPGSLMRDGRGPF